MTSDELVITNIQRFSLHDGPGIRTTVFFKGCCLHCPWCCNPETQGSVLDNGTGRRISAKALIEECLKDKAFYMDSDEKGGVTFSGGEPLLQMENLKTVCEELRIQNINMVMETSLYAPQESLLSAITYMDLFYVDMKILNLQKEKKIQGGDLALYNSNLRLLLTSKKRFGKVIIRIPLIGGYTDLQDNIFAIRQELEQYAHFIEGVELLKGHYAASHKYEMLGRRMPLYGTIDDQRMKEIKEIIATTGISIITRSML